MHSQCSVASTQILWMYCTPSCYEISHRLNSIIAENCVTAVINIWYLFHPDTDFLPNSCFLGVNLFLLSFSLHFLLSPKLIGYLKTVTHLYFLSCLKAPRVIHCEKWQCVVFTLCLRASNHLDNDEWASGVSRSSTISRCKLMNGILDVLEGGWSNKTFQ